MAVCSHLLLFLHRQKAKTYSRCKLDQAKTKYSSKWPGVFTVCLTNLVQICLDISLRTWQTMENFIELRLQHWLCLLSFSNCVSRLWKWGNINVITCHVFPIPKVRHEVITPGQAVFSLFFTILITNESLSISINIPEYCRSTSLLLLDPGRMNVSTSAHDDVALKVYI